tara:strand:- start:4595 stop:4792 length:198 start_codon:yes stop_codon:yes gene_type:complete
MGNICATERNKECLYVAKEPRNIISEFDNCILYRKRETRKQLKKKKAKLLRKVDSIDQRLSDGDY